MFAANGEAGEVNIIEQMLAARPMATVDSAHAAVVKAEVDIQISTAHAYPRSIHRFQERARTLATLNEQVAASCFYKLPRGGKDIEGPSIRMAEIAASAWGNLRVSARVISIDREMLVAQATAHDLECNNANSSEIRRRITGKNGQRYNDDMIIVTANAAMSIARRNAIFAVIPMAYITPIVELAKDVALGKGKTIEQRRQDALVYWKKLGVNEDRLCAAVGAASVEDLTTEHLRDLIGYHSAIKSGEATVEDIFPPSEKPETNGKAKPGTAGLKDSLKKKADEKKPDAPKPEEKKPAAKVHVPEVDGDPEISSEERAQLMAGRNNDASKL